MATHYILPISQPRLPDSVGTKARNIRNLKDKGYRVPDTFVCTWDAYLEYLQDDVQLVDRLMMELAGIIDPNRTYVVRSSANIEDSLNFSFAGQFKTMLKIHGIQQVMQAIWAIWASTQSLEVDTYVNKLPIDHHGIKMAVILQEMVTPEVSGVAFSKNPITSLDEIIVEAVSGSGDQLVQAGATPSRWVNKWGSWIELPEATEIPLKLIEEVAAQTQRIARSFNKDVDLEWVYNGKELFWVQMRDITSIQIGNIYSNRISKEMIPGLIKPLVWSVSIPTHSALWVSILHDLVGKNEIDLSQMIRAFHYRAYFNISVFGNIFNSLGMPRESLEMMMGLIPQGAKRPPFKMRAEMVGKIPRLSRFIWNYSRFDRIAEKELLQLEARLASYGLAGPSKNNEQQILAELEDLQLVYRQASHDTIIVQLLMFIYSRLLKWRLDKLGVDFSRFDLTEGMDELKQFDPNTGLSVLNRQFRLLDDSLQNKICEGGYAELQSLPEVKAFSQELANFLEQFGHLSDSAVDFSYAPWRETPDLILKILMDYQRNSDSEMEKIHFGDLPAHGFSTWIIGILYRRARQFCFYREAFSSLFSKSLGLLRTYYLTLAECLIKRGLLTDKTDIFYLYHSEVKQIVSGELQACETLPLVARRKGEMLKCESIVIPEIIYGETPPPITTASIKRLCGVATSRGYYTGRVKVIQNLKEFHKLQVGEVLVIPFSDTGWLPLFARAGAVITESGGMLSHSSIIAREYGIPAVVSVPGALGLRDNTLVSIDGFRGEIQVLED